MSDEVRKFRAQLDDFVADADVVRLDDEAWYDRLWELLEPVIDARAELAYRGLAKAVQPSWLDDVRRLKFPHDYEPSDAKPSPMNTDPPCRVCGQARRACEGRN